MKKLVLLIFLSYCCSLFGYAQISDSLKNDFNNKKLLVRNGKYRIGEKTYRFGNLKPEFEFSKDGLKLYLSARRNARAGNAFNFIAVGAYIAAAGMAINDYRGNQTAYLLTLGGGGLMQVVSIPFYTTARRKMRHAIFVRNKDLLLK